MLYDDLFKKKDTVESSAPAQAEAPPAADPQALLAQLVIETNPEKRHDLLNRALKFWPEDRNLRSLREFFALRYQKNDKKSGYADAMLGLLLNTLINTQTQNGPRLYKTLAAAIRKSPLVRWAETDENPQRDELYFGEWMNALAYYAYSCRNDKRYASSLMGLVRANDKKIEQMLYASLSRLRDALLGAEENTKTREPWTAAMIMERRALEIFTDNLPGRIL